MPDPVQTITEFLNKPQAAWGGRLVAGGVLAGLVWKVAEKVEGLLTDKTKHEIARWLRVRSVESGFLVVSSVTWPETCASIFDRAFGEKHSSWKCFQRSAIASIVLGCIAWTLAVFSYESFFNGPPPPGPVNVAIRVFLIPLVELFPATLCNLLPDYASLLVTRAFLSFITRHKTRFGIVPIILVLDLLVTVGIAAVPYAGVKWFFSDRSTELKARALDISRAQQPDQYLWNGIESENYNRLLLSLALAYKAHDAAEISKVEHEIEFPERKVALESVMLPSIWTSLVLWLYGLSGLAIKVVHRFDLGFDWFNRKFDIEHKPLGAIGLFAGCIVAATYWSFAAIGHFVH